MKLNSLEKIEQLRDCDENHEIAAFIGETGRASSDATLEFLKDNGLLNHESGTLMYYDDGPLVAMKPIRDFSDFVAHLVHACEAIGKIKELEKQGVIQDSFDRRYEVEEKFFADEGMEFEKYDKPCIENWLYVDDESDFVKWDTGIVSAVYLVPDSKVVDLLHHPAFYWNGNYKAGEHYSNELDYYFLQDLADAKPDLVDKGLSQLIDSGAKFHTGWNINPVELAHDPTVREKMERNCVEGKPID